MLSSLAFPIIIFASTAVNLAVALPLPLFIKESPIITASASRVTYREFAVMCIFVTALVFSIVWAFVLALLRDARASAFIGRRFRNVALPDVDGLPLPLPLAAHQDPVRVVAHPIHNVAAPSGGLARPMSASRRGRWYQS
ncbi:hypothetical protein BC827DRAFT_415175 [Russula dissimulans]|nr:hypothetical protein BC827DRAFT_415175 [Russula dissimulans]